MAEMPPITSESDHESQALAADLIIPGLAAALATYYLVSTTQLAWEARATGTTIAIVLLALCAVFAVRTFRRIASGSGRFSFGELFADTVFNRQRVALIALAVLFVATIPWIGTTLGVFLLLIAMMFVMGVRDPKRLLLIAGTSAATIYLLFIFLLNSRMPRGAVEALLARVLPPLGG